jgi:hypothetical protein
MFAMIERLEGELHDQVQCHHHLVEAIIAIDEWRLSLPSDLEYRKEMWSTRSGELSALADEWEGDIKDAITRIENMLTQAKEMVDA